ncbi:MULTISPECIES: DUF2125 domain-containing protein [unclassified Hyphomonas]|uniref:DUF2125 domain-containing protein n=1 Tax=unclassified Hyphomonas TaxID=2630699 RepID=UPI000458D7CF|nr:MULTISPECIES: DUF2125 domain-containing protein [unclassified Hyphomonas]KCZ49638.1 hypothetical protein HY17_00665 [Hyphomonas sp. CY54-11-8]
MVSSSTPKKKPRFGLFLPFVLLLLVVGAWSAWWHVASGRIDQAVDEWISEQEAQGAAFTYAGRHMGGYPFRFELVFDQPAYSGRPGEASWEGDRAEFVMQAWNLTHMIGRMPGHHVITGANGIRNSVDFDGHAAFSLSWNKAGLNRLGFQSGEAQALVGGQVYEISNLSLNLAPRPKSPDDLMIAAQWDKLALEAAPVAAPYLGTELGPSRLIGEVRSFFPAYEAAGREVGGVWPMLLEDGEVEVAQLLLDWGPLDLGAQANLTLANGRSNGAFKVRIENADALKQAMIDTGHWNQQEQIVFGTLAPASRDGGFLTLPVINDTVFVGPVPLGKLPGSRS